MELQVFENSEFGKVRTLMAENGNILFCGIDVARALGYSNPRKALLDHCKGVTKRDTLTMGGKQAISFIFEPDLYRLIIKSKLPSAERFEHWVFEQVLPSIRQDGHYLPTELQKCLNVLEEKAEYLNYLSEQDTMTSIRDTAKLLHIPERLFV